MCSPYVNVLSSAVATVCASPPAGWRSKLRLKTRVTKISYDADHVTVHTDRKRYEARFAVVTFSLGVLQQQAIEFHPALPSWKTLALHGVSRDSLAFNAVSNPSVVIF